jgi:hypothetical protein
LGRSKKKERFETEVRAALAEFAATVEIRVQAELERSRQAQLALVESIRGLHQEMSERDGDLARALREVGRAIDHSTEAISADRAERRAVVEALGKAVRAIPPPAPPVDPALLPILPRERLVGGRVESTVPTTVDSTDTVDIDLVAEERAESDACADAESNGCATRPSDHVEVQCRIEGQWIDGFEVFEIIQEGGFRRYRLRRLSDGVVMPVQYAARDVRRKPNTDGPRYLRSRSPWTRS